MKISHYSVFISCIFTNLTFASPSVERGEYLVRGPAACGNCHTPFSETGPNRSKELAGRLVETNELFTAIAPNITPGSRINDWTDNELAIAIREGLRPDGTLIGPPMPYAMYRGLSDNDVQSIVMFLRTIPAVQSDPGVSTYNFPLPPAYGPPIKNVQSIPAANTIEYGEYIAGPVAHCMECHTPLGPKGPMIDTDLGRGGFEFHGPWGTSVSSNITNHEDGLANFTDLEIVNMIKGSRSDGSPMLPPMPYKNFARMSDIDMTALVMYLRSLPGLAD